LGTIVNGLSNCIWSFSMPYMVNPDQANMKGKVAFIFFGILVVCDVFVFFYYPETKVCSHGRGFVCGFLCEANEAFPTGTVV
jgi:hypothetical protein